MGLQGFDVIVTGGTSDVGSLCLSRLVSAGRRVGAVVRRSDAASQVEAAGATALLADLLESPRADLRAPALLHVAGIRYAEQVLQAARTWGCEKVVCVSSASAVVPGHPLSASILGWEDALTSSGLVATVVRPTMIFGGPHDNNIRLLHRVTAKLPVVPVPVRGEYVQPVFVDDLAAVLVECTGAEPPTVGPVTYGGASPLKLERILRDLAAAQSKRSLTLPLSVNAIAGAIDRLGLAGRSRYTHAVTMLTERRVAPDPDSLGFERRSHSWTDALTIAVDRYRRGAW